MFHRPRQDTKQESKQDTRQGARQDGGSKAQKPADNAAPEKNAPAPATQEITQDIRHENAAPAQQAVTDSAPQNAPQTDLPPAPQYTAAAENASYNHNENHNTQTKAEENIMDNNDNQTTHQDSNQGRPAERPFGNMQSNQQVTPPQRPRAFPGNSAAYPGAATSGYTPSENYGSSSEARKLIIGQGINMSGEIDCCDHLIVEGSVEASLKGANLLEISESGVFYGTVEIDEATIAGRFEGDLLVNGRLTIRSTGSVTGSITYKEFAVEAGAVIDGKISPLGAATTKKTGSKDGGTKTKAAPRNDNQGRGNDSELPFAGSAAVEAAE